MTAPSASAERFVLCEGYDDRAFWARWLEKLGCRRAPGRTLPGGRSIVHDPRGAELPPGVFAYTTPSGAFVTVAPCDGKENVIRDLRLRLQSLDTRAADHIVISLDPDSVASVSLDVALDPLRKQIDAAIRAVGTGVEAIGDDQWTLSTTTISLVYWAVEDLVAPGVPDQQTLERLVCASIIRGYPTRGENVQGWLHSREAGPVAGPKHFAWSYYAGWFADHGTGDYYKCVWDDPLISDPLEAYLRASGAWRIAESIAE